MNLGSVPEFVPPFSLKMPRASFLRRLLGIRKEPVDRRVQDLGTLCEALLAEPAEYAGAVLAREALAAYQALDARLRAEFFDILARGYSPSPEVVGTAADAYRHDPSPENFVRLQDAVEPPRQELFRRLNMAPGGTAALMEMRRLLLKDLKAHPHWLVIDADLRHLLRSWFNRGFLRLERIDWRTSAIVLEKLIKYEAVHAIAGWGDLRRRLQADRRCFAFFHPQLPDEPIIFIEVALTRGMSAHVQPLLDLRAPLAAPDKADCAMFYSITNCQEGLRGISFGNLLIKQVAEDLKRELPHLRRFATLSPIPGFRRWLETSRVPIAMGTGGNERLALLAALEDPAWHLGEIPKELESLLTSLCAYYLTRAKQDGGPLDPVARFHLANGAALERLNWMGDSSEQGMARSAGLMVNYVYWLDEVEKNHERYFQKHEVVASPLIERLARACPIAAPAQKDAAA
jgi:malonyl-CoA decarboxylase